MKPNTRLPARLDLDEINLDVGDQIAACPSSPTMTTGDITADTGPSQRKQGKPSLVTLLHGLGGLVIVAAFVLYLFHGWRDGDDLIRCVLLVAHTVALTIAGFLSGHLLHEPRGARLFIALALAAVPVSFAFLGGIIYPHLTWDHLGALGVTVAGPQTGIGHTLAPESALLLTTAATAILASTIWLGYLVLARRSAWSLTGLYWLANTALLIPTRDELAVSGLLFVLAALLGGASLRQRRRDPTLATPEGRFARLILVLPLLVIAGRSLWLYAPEQLFFATLSLVGYLGLRQVRHTLTPDHRWRGLSETATLLLAIQCTLFGLLTLAETEGLPDALTLPIAAVLLVALLIDLSRSAGDLGRRYRGAAAMVAATSMLINLMLFNGFASALASLLVGLILLVYGLGAKQRTVFALGLIVALSGLGVMIQAALSSFTIGGWTGLVLLGIAIIVAGSLLDRYGHRLKAAAWG